MTARWVPSQVRCPETLSSVNAEADDQSLDPKSMEKDGSRRRALGVESTTGLIALVTVGLIPALSLLLLWNDPAAVPIDSAAVAATARRRSSRQRAAGRAGGSGLANVDAGIVGLIWTFFSWWTVRPFVHVEVHLNGNLIPDTSR